MAGKIVLNHAAELEWRELPGGFRYKFIAVGDRFLTGIGVAAPGGGESWHKHAPEVEETYYVLKGRGKIAWKSNDGEHALEFSKGDSMYLPYGCENMFINTGDEELVVLFNITKTGKMRE